MSNKRGYLQISFAWLFAIIVGAFILFLAIYGITKMIKTEGSIQSVKTSKEIGILLNPLETGFETAKTTALDFPTETKIRASCGESSDIDIFGTQNILIEQKSWGKWERTDFDINFPNKYIFSTRNTEGEVFHIFTKPFELPFKVADLMYITSALTEYCFVDPPEDIEDEISDINQENLKLEGECSENSIKVCFEEGSCDIIVDYDAKYVEKNKDTMYFEGDALMYAAIFSDKATYECQLKRLMQRIEQLSLIYQDKENFIVSKCDSNLQSDLSDLILSANNLQDSEDLYLVKNIADDLNENNVGCRLF